MRANQLRLWFASMAYVLFCALRRIGLAHTQFAEATCGTLRLALLRIGALVRRSVRRISVAMASAHPHQAEFALAHARLTATGSVRVRAKWRIWPTRAARVGSGSGLGGGGGDGLCGLRLGRGDGAAGLHRPGLP